MAGTGLGFRRVEGIGERSVSGTLAGLLSLTSDAVLAFDGFGRILMANEAAEHLFGRQDLVGADVRALFPPAAGVVPDDAFDPRALPFSTDGRAIIEFPKSARRPMVKDWPPVGIGCSIESVGIESDD